MEARIVELGDRIMEEFSKLEKLFDSRKGRGIPFSKSVILVILFYYFL